MAWPICDTVDPVRSSRRQRVRPIVKADGASGGVAERDETTKSKFAKRTWNVPWNQQINFLVRSTDPGAEGSHTSQKARCMRHPRLVLAARAHPTVGERSRNVSWNQPFHKVRAYRGLGCVGEYLYGAPVLVPAALPWLGPEREGRKGPPLRRCG